MRGWRSDFRFERVNDPASKEAAANGQFLMIRRDVYEAVGGHEAVRGRVLEDVALARLVKASGPQYFLCAGAGNRAHADVPDFWRDVAGLDEKSCTS